MTILSLASRVAALRLAVVAQRTALGQEAAMVLCVSTNERVRQTPDATRRRGGITPPAGLDRRAATFGTVRFGAASGSAAGAGFSPVSRPISSE
jgi:hypothetical protein